MQAFYVYVVGPSCGFPVKVGVASNIEKRVKSLQTGYPDPLVVHKVFAAGSRSAAFKIERFCHRRLEDNRMQGEWFNVFSDDAVAVLNELCEEMGYGNQRKILQHALENLGN